jgi:hypothetical protein
MEMRVQGLGVYAELLADTEFQEVREGKLTKDTIIKSPGILPGLLVGWLG